MAATSLVSGKALGQQASFQWLGTFDATEASEAQAISGDGSTIVGRNAIGWGGAFRWTQVDGIRALSNPFEQGQPIEVGDVSGDGRWTVGAAGDPARFNVAYAWDGFGAGFEIGQLQAGKPSLAQVVSSDGRVIAGRTLVSPGMTLPWRWTAENGMLAIPLAPPITSAYLTGMSADGVTLAGMAHDGNVFKPWIWTDDTAGHALNVTYPREPYRVSDLSGDGKFAVGHDSLYATRWRSDGSEEFLWQTVGPPVKTSEATACSYDGRVVVGTFALAPGVEVGFRWTESAGFQNFQGLLESFGVSIDGGWYLYPTDVSDDGNTLTGYAFTLNGGWRAWTATIPAPSTICLAVVLGYPAMHRRRVSWH